MELAASSSGINISDVIEVIETDANTKMEAGRGPYIKIVEQPASKALRFRYECEGRSAGSIPGVNSTPENKSYPTIQIVGYRGRAVVVVSCVTKDGPQYKPHPHNLVGRDGCKKGVCTVEVQNESMTQSFDHLGIQCVKKKDIEEALRARAEIRVDPFMTGFHHKTAPGSIDLNAVRLCFQAFIENEPGKFKHPLVPVVSEIIYDKKALCDLAICKLSHCAAPVAGGMEMILLCEKVAKEDISVRFYEERNGQVVWEGWGEVSPTNVHKQVAIAFKTPRYKTLQVENPVQAYIQLQRPSDKQCSDPLPFQFTPLDSGSDTSRKRPRIGDRKESMKIEQDTMRAAAACQMSPGLTVKPEPADTSPNPYLYPGGGLSPITFRQSPSPIQHDYNPHSPIYHGTIYATTSTGFNVGNVTVAPVSPQRVTHTPLVSASTTYATLSPPPLTPQALVGRVSPQPDYSLPPNPATLYVIQGPTATLLESINQGNNITDISSPMISAEPMKDIVINSKDLTEYMSNMDEGNLSENLSLNLSLNCESNQVRRAGPQQGNMTDSLNSFVNNAFNEFQG